MNTQTNRVDLNNAAQAKKTVLDFLKWYKSNIRKANSFPLLGYDSAGFAYVDKKGYMAYLQFMKTSKLLSTNYQNYWKKYFEDEAIKIKNDKLTKNDVPEGFDFDFVLITQEPEIVLENLSKLLVTVKSISSKEAVVELSLPGNEQVNYSFELQKTKTGWLIDYIATANFD